MSNFRSVRAYNNNRGFAAPKLPFVNRHNRPQAAARRMSRIAAVREVRYAFRLDEDRSPSEVTRVACAFSFRFTLHVKKFTHENKALRGMLFRLPVLSSDFTSHNKLDFQ